jgi:hypothetical protein
MMWWKKIPDDPLDNLKIRLGILKRAEYDLDLQNGLREMCKHDILFFISLFVWQFNPKKSGLVAAMPFIPWELQKRALLKKPGVPWPEGEDEDEIDDAGLIWVIENQKSLLIEKSREMGASWLCLLVFLWYFLFHPYSKFHCISRNEEKVESADADSLFWKLDYAIENLPRWLLPRCGIERKKRFFGRDDDSTTQITGEACTSDAGISGRCRAMLMDEFAKVKNGAEIRVGTAHTSDCCIFNSTHEGLDTEFYDLSITPEVYKLRMHWSQHPEKMTGAYVSDSPPRVLDKTYTFPGDYEFVKDGKPLGGPRPGLRSVWYDEMVKRIGEKNPWGISRDLDINPAGSVSQFFDAVLINELQRRHARSPLWTGELQYDRQTGKGAVLVPNREGRLWLWVMPNVAGKIPAARYGGGADISMGTGASPSCIALGNADCGEKVLEYQNPHLSPDEFTIFCFALLSLFLDESGTPPLFSWEHKGPGALFTKKFMAMGYRHVYYHHTDLVLRGKFREANDPGFNPMPENMKIMLKEYETALKKGDFMNRSQSALEEMKAWKYNKNGYPTYGAVTMSMDSSGAKDNHGDQTVADGICCMMMGLLGVNRINKVAEKVQTGSLQWRMEIHKDLKRRQEAWV